MSYFPTVKCTSIQMAMFSNLNDQLGTADVIADFKQGDSLFVENYLVEFLEDQWKISSFVEKPHFNSQTVLLKAKSSIYPANFPVYRRSPRVLPTIYDKRQRIENPKNPPTKPKMRFGEQSFLLLGW